MNNFTMSFGAFWAIGCCSYQIKTWFLQSLNKLRSQLHAQNPESVVAVYLIGADNRRKTGRRKTTICTVFFHQERCDIVPPLGEEDDFTVLDHHNVGHLHPLTISNGREQKWRGTPLITSTRFYSGALYDILPRHNRATAWQRKPEWQ